MKPDRHPGVVVTDADELRRVVAGAAAHAVLELAGSLMLTESLRIERPLHLRAASGPRPVLSLSGDACVMLAAGAGGSSLTGIALTGRGHRARPLLEMRSAAGCVLRDLLLTEGEGAGLDAGHCDGLVLRNVILTELGLQGAAFTACAALDAELALSGIGRRARSAAVTLQGGSGVLRVRAADVSGNAIALQPGDDDKDAAHQVELQASQCFRGLAVMGQAERVVKGTLAQVVAEEMEDCAVLLSNCRAVTLDLHARKGAALHMGGAAGARECRVTLRSDRPGQIVQRGGSGANIVVEEPLSAWPAGEPPPRHASWQAHSVEETCHICGWHGRFRRTHRLLRETFACPACRATLRYRAQAAALLSAVAGGGHATLKALAESGWFEGSAVFEPGQSGPLRPYLSRAGRYHASVFRSGIPSGEMVNGVECQDLTATSFADASFDLVVTSDIMEHVRRPERAWAEIRRILKPGGFHVFSIPLMAPMPRRSVARVDTTGDADIHLLPPVYHGDGAGGLSLVYTDFGADLLDKLAAHGLPTQALPYPGGDPVCGPVLSFVSRRDP
ncbi:class I SAM-dependent methyltransferase [Roseomonas sp. SSH11]|uniref:Class I SAM-dependent methyltransferase n=1 Tax=Pararoseomonas baculiformis TaxID=2820812 RepID=A0ABS4ADH6_9PROT|nr:class I SAM-dependent methyltransferase [Pararoseomonas baculiformis]